MRIKGNGRVGIGTNNPTGAKLVVKDWVHNAQDIGRYFEYPAEVIEIPYRRVVPSRAAR
jgi:hypothetical protein